MIRPSMEEARDLSRTNRVIPIAMEIFADVKTPIQLLATIRKRSNDWFILESVSGSDNWGRYTFLGYKPSRSIFGTQGTVTIESKGIETVEQGSAFSIIRRILSEHKSPRIDYLPPFTGGFVGYFAYDFVQELIPKLELTNKKDLDFHDFHLMLIDKVIAFDNFEQKIFLITNIASEDLENNYIEGITTLKDMEKLVLENHVLDTEDSSICGLFEDACTQDEFEEMVEQVKAHIFEGDIFQAVISNRSKASFKGDLMGTYRRLRTSNPSPYMVYMRLDDIEIACASPETLVSLRDGEVISFPLAGTCARGENEEQDAALIDALLHNEKECSEHDMLVDLARNDLGRVCRFGSVDVREHRKIKKFAHVSHIASRVSGELKQEADALDVIAATLPAGTLSGAPKKRACEIIDEIESVARGIYGGAIGYIDFAGNMDMCIGIRMAILKDDQVMVQSGAGIVADSDASQEYLETKYKARAMMNAITSDSRR